MSNQVRDNRSRNWSWFNNEVYDQYGDQIEADGLAVYMGLCRHSKNGDETSYPAVATIARRIARSERQVQRKLDQLAALGLIAITPQFDADGRQKPNLYTLLDVPPVAGEGDYQSPRPVVPVGGRVSGSHREGVRESPGRVTTSHREGDYQSPKQDSRKQDLLNKRGGEQDGASAPPPPLTIEAFTPDEAAYIWVAGECHASGLPSAAIHIKGETAKWQDAIISGQRKRPTDPPADWRIWMRHAVKWAKQHPEEWKHGESTGRDPAATAERHAAEADRAAAELRAALTALPGPGRVAG